MKVTKTKKMADASSQITYQVFVQSNFLNHHYNELLKIERRKIKKRK